MEKKTPEQLAREYMEGIDFSNNTGIYIVNEMQGTAYQGYLDGYNARKEEATEKQLKDFVIKLRKKDREFEKQQKFCRDHNFNFEEQIFEAKAQLVRKIAMEMERDFDLGFVWDESLND